MSPACERREFLAAYLAEMAEGIVDLVEGKDPTNWEPLNSEDLERRADIRRRVKLRDDKATTIQRWWRSLQNNK